VAAARVGHERCGLAELDDCTGLAETVARFEEQGFEVTGLIASSEDDWDHYESLHWGAMAEWLAENPDHPHAGELRAAHDASAGATSVHPRTARRRRLRRPQGVGGSLEARVRQGSGSVSQVSKRYGAPGVRPGDGEGSDPVAQGSASWWTLHPRIAVTSSTTSYLIRYRVVG
jgi:hypothetical protein